MKPPAPHFAYRLLCWPLLLFWVTHALRHGLKHRSSCYLSHRLQWAKATARDPAIWIHASSVGEVQSISPLVRKIIERGHRVMFTSFTATGLHCIEHNFAGSVDIGVIPIESAWLCRRFFRQRNFRLGLIMETELWPELLYQARRADISLLQVNARLSTKSSEQREFVRRLLQRTLACFERILTRSKRDQAQLLAFGVDAGAIDIIGNLKTRPRDDQPKPRLLERDYILLASSHDGEEYEFIKAMPRDPEADLVVIAPRHPERADSILKQLEPMGLEIAQRSRGDSVSSSTSIYLADTLGELKAFMAHARVVVMGGSFDDTGGHNLIEPASLGCAIITGPSDSNIREDIDMLGDGDGLLQVRDIPECWQRIRDLQADSGKLGRLGETALHRLAQQPDVVQRYLSAIEPWLGEPPRDAGS